MKKAIRRWAAWMLAGVLLFNLMPMNPTHAGEKAAAYHEAAAAEESTADDQKGSGEKADVDGADSADDKNTEAEKPDSGASNAGGETGSTQTSTETDIEQGDSDTAEQDTAKKEETGTASVEENAGIQDPSEEQTDSKSERSDGDKAVSTEDTFRTLANEGSSTESRKVEGTISVKIDGKPVSPGNQSDPIQVTSASKVVISFDYKIMNSDNLKVNEHCYYDLPVSGVSIDNKGIIYDRGGNEIGAWVLQNDRLEFWFTDEDFLTNNIIGKIDLEGTVNLDDVDLGDDGSGKIRIADDFYNIIVDKSKLPAEVKAEKTAGSFVIDDSNNYNYQVITYTITVTALTDAKNVAIEDQLVNAVNSSGSDYAGISQPSLTIVSTKRGEITTDIVTSNTWEWINTTFSYKSPPYYKGFRGQISNMEKGEIITITYTVHAHPDLYLTPLPTGKTPGNNLTVTDRFDRTVYNESVPFPDYQITVEKSGVYQEEDGTVTWTITVKNPDRMNLSQSNLKIHDESTGYQNGIYVEDSTQHIMLNSKDTGIPVFVFMQQDFGFPELLGRSGISSPTEPQYVIEYTLKVKDEYKNKLKQTEKDENKVQIIDSNNTILTEAKKEVGIGPTKPVIEKSHDRVGANQIKWKLTFNVPAEGLENPVIHDEYDNTMTLDKGSVTITGAGSDAFRYTVVDVSPETDNNGKAAFEIRFQGTVPAGTYEITYITSYGKDSDARDYKNTAKVIVGDDESAPASDSLAMKDGMSKWAVRDNSASTNQTYYGTTVQTWRLQLKDVANMNGSSYLIEDTWSSGYEYVEGSLQAHPKASAANSDETYLIQPQKTYNGIKFDITGAVKYAKANWKNSLYITYQTRMKEDMAKDFLNSYGSSDTYSITNTAVLYEDGYPLYISPDAKAASKPKAVITKVGNYDMSTVPFAEYAINVNPGGNDLLKNGDTLVVRDTLPDNFALVTGSVQVYHSTVGTTSRDFMIGTQAGDPLEKGQWSYSCNDQILTITIPDEMEVIIKYKVIVEARKGTELTEANATNTVELSGVNLDSNKSSYSLQGQVMESSALARSETAKLTIYKHDADAGLEQKFLSGAEFQVRMVAYDNAAGSITEPDNTPQGYKGAQKFTTNEEGYYTVTNLYFDHLYELVETKAPDGYVMDDTPRYFVFIGHDNPATDEEIDRLYPEGTKTYYVDFGETHVYNKQKDDRDIYISKKALTGNDDLPGAHIVLKEEGQILEEWDTTGEAKRLPGDLFQADKEYVLTETAAPDGYEVTADIVFTVDKNDGTVSFSTVNTNKDAEIGHYEGTSGGRNNHIIIRDKKEEVTTEEKTTEEKTTTNTSSNTGDTTPIGALAGLMIFSTTAVVFTSRRKKKYQ